MKSTVSFGETIRIVEKHITESDARFYENISKMAMVQSGQNWPPLFRFKV